MKNPPRKFEIICGDSPSNLWRERITAAFWSQRYTADDEPGDFVYFKDSDGKPVLAVAVGLIHSIQEIRNVPVIELDWEELRVASTALIEFGRTANDTTDSDAKTFRETAERIGWKLHGADRIVDMPEDPIKHLIEQVQKGLLTIDEARIELGRLPWGLPETEERKIREAQ